MAEIQPVPQWAPPFLGNEEAMEALGVIFNPVWLKWFIDLINQLTSGGAVNHNQLNGLQGGAADEYYHLTQAKYNLLNATQLANRVLAGPASGAPAAAAFRALVTADLADAIVTYAKIQDVLDDRLLGRSSGSDGPPMEITVGSGLALDAGALSFAPTVGTWTPGISFAVPGDLSVTYAQQVGGSVQFGSTVIQNFSILTSAFTHTTASGNFRITGTPVTISSSPSGVSYRGAVTWGGITKAGYTSVVTAPNAGTQNILLVASGSGVAPANLAVGDFPSGGTVQLNGTVIFQV